MAQNKNNSKKKNDLESIIEKEKMRTNKAIEELSARVSRLISDRKKLISCLVFVKNKLSGEDILISKLIIEIGKTLQEVNNNKD